MAQEKVSETRVTRERGFLYYIGAEGVYRAPMRPGGGPKQASTESDKVLVAPSPVVRESGYMYFLDKDGDIARTRRQVGGKPGQGPKKKAKSPRS